MTDFSEAGTETFSVEVSHTPEGRHIVASGELDGAEAEAVQSLIDDATPSEQVTLDVSALTFIDSMGLRMLVDWHRRLQQIGGQLVIRRPSMPVERVLAATQLDRILQIDGRSSDAH
jgi:anti-anti-sigma factor